MPTKKIEINGIQISSVLTVDNYSAIEIKFTNEQDKKQFLQQLREQVQKYYPEQEEFVENFLSQVVDVNGDETKLRILPSKGKGQLGTYISADGQLSVNFGSSAIRNAFVNLLGINHQHADTRRTRQQALHFALSSLAPISEYTLISGKISKLLNGGIKFSDNVNDRKQCQELIAGLLKKKGIKIKPTSILVDYNDNPNGDGYLIGIPREYLKVFNNIIKEAKAREPLHSYRAKRTPAPAEVRKIALPHKQADGYSKLRARLRAVEEGFKFPVVDRRYNIQPQNAIFTGITTMMGIHPNDLMVVDDINKPGKKVLKIKFDNPADAELFANKTAFRNRNGTLNRPPMEGNNMVVLGEDRAKWFFKRNFNSNSDVITNINALLGKTSIKFAQRVQPPPKVQKPRWRKR